MAQGQERLVSLDAFRGLTMALMVVVNTAGSPAIFHQFVHADWHGWTVADTVFPSFLWIVGVAITLVLSRRMAAGISRGKLMAQAARRAFVLFAFGLIVYAAPGFDLGTQRILGVLQRIAICYFAATVICLYTDLRGRITWTVCLLITYWLLLKIIPVPVYGAGDLSIAGNLEHYVDRLLLGAHNYSSTRTWDPEGVLSTIPAIATTLLGVLAGHVLRLKKELAERTNWFFVAGCFLLVSGLVCDVWMPINKHIWTSSFVLLMAGIDFLTYGVMLWLVDGCGYKRAVKPLAILGVNAIAVYMLSELLAEVLDIVHVGGGNRPPSVQQWIYRGIFLKIAPDQTAALLYAIAYLLLMYAFAYALYRKQWFLRV